MILFILGIAITLDLIFGLVIYIFLISDNALEKRRKKEKANISDIDVKNVNVDTSFWG